MAEGMKRGTFYHGDPTYEEARAHISKEIREKERKVRDFFEGLRRDVVKLSSIRLLLKQYEIDMAGIKALRYDKEHVSSSYIGDLSDIIIRIEEKMATQTEKIVLLQEEILKQRETAYRYISLLSGHEAEQSILMDRYITGLSWERIAHEHHYDRDYCMQLRNNGIKGIARKI